MTATDSTGTDKRADRSAYQKAWRDANREKRLAYAAEYYAANKEKLRAQQAENYIRKSDEYKARAAVWAKVNPERRYEVVDKYRRENREVYRTAGRREYERNKEVRLAKNKEYRANNGDKMRALNAAWHVQHPEANAHHVGLRRTRKQQATPAWADLDAIKAVYREAARLKKETGLAWHVDHEIPLKHPLVCGLHVAANLQILPARDNQSKHNAFEL